MRNEEQGKTAITAGNNSSMVKDRFHDLVKAALQKEGWKITHDPYELRVGDVDFEVDLAAELLIAAEKDR